MNFYDMRQQFDRIVRTLSETSFEAYRDDYLNQAWQSLSEAFLIPGLKKTVYIDSVADQSKYLLPYDYAGTEVALMYKSTSSGNYKRLDPVTEDVMKLIYERRSGNMGSVRFYDWTDTIGSDLAARTACTLVNGSTTVLCATAAAGDAGHWVRFDPFVTGTTTYDPGDYGYLISSVTVGVSWTLSKTYRGPAGSATGRVRPAEQQQFVVYGNPSDAVTSAFELVYYAKPKRLYNNADVPEWPDLGLGIVLMAVSVGYDYLHDKATAATWWGRAMQKVGNLQKRRNQSQTLVTDLTIGSVSGRKTGPDGVVGSYNYRR